MRTLAIAAVGAALVLAPPSAAQTAQNFELVRVADGVHVAVQRDPLADPIDGNTTIIVNDSDVVVIDTRITPGTAEAVVEAIRRLTPKPVRYVVNTHFHSDHHYGNDAFRRAWPGVEFIAHEHTLADLLTQDNDSVLRANRERYPKIVEDRRRWLAAGKRDDGTVLSPELRALYERQVDAFGWAIPELGRVRLVRPTVTVRDGLVIRRGERTIEIRHLGRANTRGDLVVHLPRERVVITGDVLVAPVPFSFGSFLGDWVETLAAVRALPADVIVPGHGMPQRDWSYLDRVSRLLQATLAQARLAVAEGKDLEATRAAVKLDGLKREFAGDDWRRQRAFDAFFVAPAVERAWREARGELGGR